jgi:hypothetical protein
MFFSASVLYAYFFPSSPIFFFSWTGSAILAVIATPLYANLFIEIHNSPMLTSVVDMFGMTASLIQNLPLLIIYMMAVLITVSYTKPPTTSMQIGA